MIFTRMVTIGLFLAAFVLFGVVELVARVGRSQVPTLGQMCGFLMGYRVGRVPVGRVAVLTFWWWLGWHFFAR
jgi:Family of unknown function (DUF6186)